MDQNQGQPMGAPPPYTAQPGPGEVQKAYNPDPAQSSHPGYQTQPANVYQAQPPQPNNVYQAQPPEPNNIYQAQPPQPNNVYQAQPPEPNNIYQAQPPQPNNAYQAQPPQPNNVYQAQPPQAAYRQHSAQYVKPQQTDEPKVMVTIQQFGENPMVARCVNCNKQVITYTIEQPGLLTWGLAITLCVIGLWCGCCLIPFYIRECNNIEHRCPHCGNHLGVYKRI